MTLKAERTKIPPKSAESVEQTLLCISLFLECLCFKFQHSCERGKKKQHQ